MYYVDILLRLYAVNHILDGIAEVCGFVLRNYDCYLKVVIFCQLLIMLDLRLQNRSPMYPYV